jgi:hypothetical protein
MGFKGLGPKTTNAVVTVENLAELNAIVDPQEGDLRYVKDINQLYAYSGASWLPSSSGMIAPGSTTVDSVVRWDDIAGTTVTDSVVTISDAGAVAGATSLTVDNIIIDDNTINANTGDLILDVTGGSNRVVSRAGLNIEENTGLRLFDSTNTYNALFSVSSLGSNRTYTMPDLTGTLALTTGAQTIRQKTIDNTNTVSVSALAFTLEDHVFDTKKAKFDASGVTLGATRTFTFPNASGTLEITANKGAANGYASLDGGGKVPAGQLPASIMDYLGVWNASTNTPALADGLGSAGDVYNVSVAGTQNLGSGNISFSLGDWVIYNGTVWEKSDNADDVVSVNGFTGTVVLDAGDIGSTPSGNLAATTVQGALDELQGDIDTRVAGPASATDNALVRFDGTTGKVAQNSVVTIDDVGVIAGATELQATGNLTLYSDTGNIFLSNGTGGDVRVLEGVVGLRDTTSSFYSFLTATPGTLSADHDIYVPNLTGTMALLENAQTFTGAKTVSGTTFDVVRESTSGYASTLRINTYGSAGNFSTSLQLRSARGTASSPTATQANDVLGGVGARGYGTTGFGTGDRASIRFFAGTSNWTDADQAAGMSFYTNPSGTSERLSATIQPDGDWEFTGSDYHSIAGGVELKTNSSSNGSVSAGSVLDMCTNVYRKADNTFKVLQTQTGYTQLRLINTSASGSEALSFWVNYQDAQTAGSGLVTTNERKIARALADGTWNLGPTVGGSLTHVIQSGTETALTINSVGATADAYINLNSNAARVWSFGYDQGTTSFVFNQGSGVFGGNNVGRISSGGLWTLGTTSNTAAHVYYGALAGYSNSSVASNQVLYLHSDVGGTDVLKWRVDNDGDTISATGSYTSDIRVKKDVEPIHYGLSEILQLQPMSFRWSYESASDVKSFSVDSAQNVEQLMPELVRDDGLEFEDSNGVKFQTKAIYEKEIVAVLVKAIQEQQAIIDSLTARIDALENT